jgi:hypothetical protein
MLILRNPSSCKRCHSPTSPSSGQATIKFLLGLRKRPACHSGAAFEGPGSFTKIVETVLQTGENCKVKKYYVDTLTIVAFSLCSWYIISGSESGLDSSVGSPGPA